jgi:hypothetical protein
MASSDFTVLTGASALDTTNVLKNTTNGISRPKGGGNFLHGFNSKTTAQGVAGYYATPQGGQTNFAPMLKGGSVRAAFKRGASAGNLNFAPILFAGFQTNAADAVGYVLGLGDASPAHIVLRKLSASPPANTVSLVATGLPDVAAGSQGVLMRSTATYDPDTWVHVRLDVVWNTNGDVILKVYASAIGQNDAASGESLTVPNWVLVPGMENFVDDNLGVNSAQGAASNPPHVGGYAGFAQWSKDSGRRSYFDGYELWKQL